MADTDIGVRVYLGVERKLVEFHVLEEGSADAPLLADGRPAVAVEGHRVPGGLFDLAVDVLDVQPRRPLFVPIYFVRFLQRFGNNFVMKRFHSMRTRVAVLNRKFGGEDVKYTKSY